MEDRSMAELLKAGERGPMRQGIALAVLFVLPMAGYVKSP